MTRNDALHSDRPNRYDLTRLTVAAATYRDLDDGSRASLADMWRGALLGNHVLLETCHRVELVSFDPPHDPTPPGVHVVAGRAAVQRVFEVVAGFDSAVMAEEEILGQARGAFNRALTTHTSGPVLNELFRRALRFGRRVRSHAKPGTDRSLIDPALAWLLPRLPARGRVVVVGAGVMGRMAATRTAASDHPITVVTASSERGGQLLGQLPGHDHALVVGQLDRDVVQDADGMVIAVRGQRDVLRGDVLNGRTLPVVDLSSPSVVSADGRRSLGENLLDVDRLGGVTSVRSPLSGPTLRRLGVELQAEVDAFVAWLGRRGNADAVATLRAQAAELRQRHLSRLRQRAALDDGQLAQVESATTALLNELLHGPTVQLRQGGADAATVRRLFELGS